MFKHNALLSLMAIAALLAPPTSIAAENGQDQKPAQGQVQKKVYGGQLMTNEERMEHRAKLRSLKTREERDAYRLEHHKKMQERAREKGLVLPDEPPIMRKGMRP